MTVRNEEQKFDPSNSIHIMTEQFRAKTVETFLEADAITIWREMPYHEQMSAFTSGVISGLLCTILVGLNPKHEAEVIKGIQDAIALGVPSTRDFLARAK